MAVETREREKEKQYSAKPIKVDQINREIQIYLNIEEGDTERFRRKYASVPKEFQMTIAEKTKDFSVAFGDIWFVDLGINVGSEMDKVRPVVVVSANDSFNYFSKLITVIPITHSVCKYPSQFHVAPSNFIMKEEAHPNDTPISGVAKAEQIRAVSKGRFLHRMGKLSDDGIADLKVALRNHMGL